jgi:K+-transporting ATPase ATPase A chain
MHAWQPFCVVLFAVVVLAPFLGAYIAALVEGRRTFLYPALGWLERSVYRLCGVREDEEMPWGTYAWAAVGMTFLGIVFVFAIQMFQGSLPFNPQGFGAVPWRVALNTAVSFATNTNWQAYSGETSLSYATQMFALTSQNFLSAAIGMAVLMAFIRGLVRQPTRFIGNFWVDITRVILYLLLPLSFVMALVLVPQGIIQTVNPYEKITGLEGHEQVIPLGPVASQEAIKLLGTNGGGFFSVNSAHPFENPTQVTNLLGIIALVLIPIASVYAYGLLIGSKRHGFLLIGVMVLLFFLGLSIAYLAETRVNPFLGAAPQFEGKEVRFGVPSSIMWSVATTATANGSVNAMLDSLSPIAGGIALFNMMLGELIFGGVGVGLCSMLIFVLLTVFLSGLMVGRTPEYLGKKIELREIQWVMLAVLLPCLLILGGASVAIVNKGVVESLVNKGPHGLTGVLYAYTSGAQNNGSAFGGVDDTTDFMTLSLSVVMFMGRLAIMVPSIALAGCLAGKKSVQNTTGTFSTNTLLFATLLIAVIFIVGALTYFSVISLGPIVEHIMMIRGR